MMPVRPQVGTTVQYFMEDNSGPYAAIVVNSYRNEPGMVDLVAWIDVNFYPNSVQRKPFEFRRVPWRCTPRDDGLNGWRPIPIESDEEPWEYTP